MLQLKNCDSQGHLRKCRMHFTEFNGARKPANGCHLPIFKMDSTLALLRNYQIKWLLDRMYTFYVSLIFKINKNH